MHLIAVLHRSGLNTALIAGLLLMPVVVATGFWADPSAKPTPALHLRGTIDGDEPGGGQRAALTRNRLATVPNIPD